MKQTFLLYLIYVVVAIGCKKAASNPSVRVRDTTMVRSSFIKGADVSWLTQMEASNIPFYDSTGKAKDCLEILKEIGMNAVRLRVWVNPLDGWCNTADLLAKAIRANNLGFQILLDFHYSDSWADPGQQTKPAKWNLLTFKALDSAVFDYTVHVLDTLKAQGITPRWVQIGNETNDGMLWEDGRASTNMKNFASLVNAGYRAVKSVNDSIKVIVHISNGFDNNLFRWMFDGLLANGANWDIIGMSLYPSTANWQTLDNQCQANMTDMVSRYGKPIMICEVGMDVTAPATCKAFLTDIISKTASLPNQQGLGVFYWEPESYNNWQGYALGAFDHSGKPSIALQAFSIN